MKLAWGLGMPMYKLVEEMPADELMLWQAWMQEPRGEDRDDWRAASICQVVHSVGQSFSKSRRKIATREFKLKFEAPKTFEQRNPIADARRISRAFGGIIPKEVIEKGKKKLDEGDFWTSRKKMSEEQ